MSRRRIPYTHWAYFEDREDADECATKLNEVGLLVRIDPSASDPDRWLLRASWDIEVDEEMNGWDEAHDRVEAVVEWHGGLYDGGESGWLDIETGRPAYGSAADQWFAEGGWGADDDAATSDDRLCAGYGRDPATADAAPGVPITDRSRPGGRLCGWVRVVAALTRRAVGRS